MAHYIFFQYLINKFFRLIYFFFDPKLFNPCSNIPKSPDVKRKNFRIKSLLLNFYERLKNKYSKISS